MVQKFIRTLFVLFAYLGIVTSGQCSGDPGFYSVFLIMLINQEWLQKYLRLLAINAQISGLPPLTTLQIVSPTPRTLFFWRVHTINKYRDLKTSYLLSMYYGRFSDQPCRSKATRSNKSRRNMNIAEISSTQCRYHGSLNS